MDLKKVIDKEKILKEGITVRVKRSGMFQRVTLNPITEKKAGMQIRMLESKRTIDLQEVERLVQEIGLPIKAPNGLFIPKGKMLNDFGEEE